MATSEKDIKILWGLSAGLCSKPDCEERCIKFLDDDNPTVLGEMAHVIAKRPDGPRGIPQGGSDSYENLILLCPTHHREVDKAVAGTYDSEMLFAWKDRHEGRLSELLKSRKFENTRELGRTIKLLLIENRDLWKKYGPESGEADQNPLSNAYKIWNLRKLDTVVPNNRKIIHNLEHNKDLIDIVDYEACIAFKTHAEGFEKNCYDKIEGVPRFPPSFEELINRYAES